MEVLDNQGLDTRYSEQEVLVIGEEDIKMEKNMFLSIDVFF